MSASLPLFDAGDEAAAAVEPAEPAADEPTHPLAPEHRVTLVRLLAQLVDLHDDIAPTPLRAAE